MLIRRDDLSNNEMIRQALNTFDFDAGKGQQIIEFRHGVFRKIHVVG